MLTSTITIYNYVKELSGKAQYTRWVISGLVVDNNKGRNRLVSGDASADTATFYFMYKNVDMSKYKPYIEWKALSEEDKALYWTIDTLSIIALGEQTYEIKTQTTTIPPIITTTGTVAGLKAIADVYQITNIDVRERGSIAANHIEVGAR